MMTEQILCPHCRTKMVSQNEFLAGTVTVASSFSSTSTVSIMPSGLQMAHPVGGAWRHLRCPNCEYARVLPDGE